jgi:hypothetical protein
MNGRMYWHPDFPSRRPHAAAPFSRRFIIFSTAVCLGLAGIIGSFFPDLAAIAWALVIFSATQAAFLFAQLEPFAKGGDDWHVERFD